MQLPITGVAPLIGLNVPEARVSCIERPSLSSARIRNISIRWQVNGIAGTATVRHRYQAVLFDLLTALIDSWSLWNEIAGSAETGRKWRAEYLRLTYGCGRYRPYEEIVAEAAESIGLGREYAERLTVNWPRLTPWPEAASVLADLSKSHRLGVVTNCSERLGRIAAERVGARFDVVITAERAGYYKPDPRPYQLALEEIGVSAAESLFVAGSAYDLFGTSRVSLDTYWHNRAGLAAPEGAPRPLIERASLHDLPRVARVTIET